MTESEKNDEAFFNMIIVTMVTAIFSGSELLRQISDIDDFWVSIQLATGVAVALCYFYHPDRPHPRTALAYTALVLVHFGLVNGQPNLIPTWGLVLGTVAVGMLLPAFATFVASTRKPRDRTCSIEEIKQAASQ